MKLITKIREALVKALRRVWHNFLGWWHKNIWHKLIAITAAILVFCFGSMYGIAQWYIYKYRNEPIVWGATFVPNYALYLGLSPQNTLRAVVEDLGIKHLRLVSYWDDMEPMPGQYKFGELDWQFALAEKNNVEVSLAIGLRQPRWPECHMPAWAAKLPKSQWTTHLNTFMAQVMNRYQNSPALKSYQLENEFFMEVFGECKDFDRQRLINEYNFVKKLDPGHPVVISRSNNWVGLPVGQPRPDEFAISVYKRVWDKAVTKRYFEYPLPAWFYAFLAGAGQLVTGRNMFIHELQAEPWLPEGYDLRTSSIAEQNKSMNADRLRHRLEYGRATGMKTIELWGVEWWYWRKQYHKDPSLWQVAKEEIGKTKVKNAQLNSD